MSVPVKEIGKVDSFCLPFLLVYRNTKNVGVVPLRLEVEDGQGLRREGGYTLAVRVGRNQERTGWKTHQTNN